MKLAIIVLALLIAGCTEQTEKPQELPPLPPITMRFNQIGKIPEGAVIDSARIIVEVGDCQEIRNFANWCQKAHPEVWREYHATHTGGE